MQKTITLAILAGGQSRRMGRDKALLPLHGKPLLQHVIERTAGLNLPRLIVANAGESYARFGLPVIADKRDGGALGGIYSALCAAQTPYVLCIACDMPFVESAVLRRLIGRIDGVHDIVVPLLDGHPQPLHAIYRRNCRAVIAAQIDAGQLAIHRLFSLVDTLHIPAAALLTHSDQRRSFVNLNTPDDLQAYQ